MVNKESIPRTLDLKQLSFDLKVLVQFIAALEKCATGAPLENLLEIMIITSTLIPSKAP